MARAQGRREPTFAAVAVAAVLAGCASPHSAERPTAPDTTRAAAPVPAEDWRSLITVPFGTLLKDVPYRLAEVVVFHDASGAPATHADRECYSLQESAPPRWFGRPVEEYSLCFSSDRLNRIEASVSLAAESASARFAAACAEWRRRGTPGESASDRCEDRDGSTLVQATLMPAGASGEPTVSITLVDPAPSPDGTP
jgi:hypothetical protein